MHCNLKPADVAPVVLRLNYEVYTKSEVRQFIRSSLIAFSLLIPHVTL